FSKSGKVHHTKTTVAAYVDFSCFHSADNATEQSPKYEGFGFLKVGPELLFEPLSVLQQVGQVQHNRTVGKVGPIGKFSGNAVQDDGPTNPHHELIGVSSHRSFSITNSCADPR